MVLPRRHRRNGDVNNHAIKQLHKCIRSVLNGTTSTDLGSCLGKYSDVSLKRTHMAKIKNKLLQFRTCMCNPPNMCRFNLGLFEPNQTVLERCFGKMEEAPFPYRFQTSRFACEVGQMSDYKIRCESGDFQQTPKSKRLEEVLHCFSPTMEDIQCSIRTTSAPITTTTSTSAPPVSAVVIFVLALLISLLLGVLGTGLGIFCCRKKKRNRTREFEEPSGHQSKNYITPVARYNRQGDMPDMVVELPHLERQNVYHDYHILEPTERNIVPVDQHLDNIHRIDGESDDGYDPVCNTYEELEDYDLEARPVPKPKFQGHAENRESSAPRCT